MFFIRTFYEVMASMMRKKVSTAAGQKNNGNYNDNSSINVSFKGGTMFFGFVFFCTGSGMQ